MSYQPASSLFSGFFARVIWKTQSTRKCRALTAVTPVTPVSFSCSKFFTSFTQSCKHLYECMLMVRRSASLVVWFMNFAFCCFRRDARNFAVIETSVLQEKQFPYFCLFLAINLCKYLPFICLISIFFTDGIYGEKCDSHHVGAGIRILFLLTTRLQLDPFSGFRWLKVAIPTGMYVCF